MSTLPRPDAGPVRPDDLRRDAETPRPGAALFFAATLATFMAASSAPTPLYRLYQAEWSFSPAVLTVVFGIYALGLLAALLTVGGLSDHLGRRPVIFAALLLQAAAIALFIAADSTAALMVARAVQGFATGAATGALAAALLDADRDRGPLINSLINPVGMALGALGASVLVDYAPWPMRLVYGVLLAAFVVQAGLVWLVPETLASESPSSRPGALASLRPKIAVPPRARETLARITPVNVAVWGLGGFYLSLAPSLLRAATDVTSALAGGSLVATLTASGALAILVLRGRPAHAVLTAGAAVLAAGVATILLGVHAHHLALLFIGTMVAGFGWGGAFLGVLRVLLPLAAPAERAGLMSAYFVQSYLAMSVPAILAGVLARSIGLVPATDVYAAGLLALVALALAGAIPRRITAPSCPAARHLPGPECG
ncbi:MAG: MFS transporter [Rhodoplanes sp.]|uniref:MFS transporter n=1 Tax=Rhodoplanes sp. TaxID=1968906 RepID=UPI00180BBEC4|nr:MFS transporter [Rhodoplanes sp.]NVO16797.1 MFS transporter [Rhodoplanes sp.]